MSFSFPVGEGNTGTAESSFSQDISREQQPSSASERQTPRAPQSPRRPPHPLPPRLTIHAPPQELGPPVQVVKVLVSLKNLGFISPSFH